MSIYKCLIALILLILTLVPLAIAGEEVVKDGVIHVINSDVPTEGIEVLKLEELWRIGGEGEDAEFIFTSLDQVLWDKNDNIYILDGFSDLIYVFNKAGTLGRVIDFSGEIYRYGREQIITMFLKGDEIALVSKGPIQIICIDYFGMPGDTKEFPIIFDTIIYADWGNEKLILGGLSMLRNKVFLSRFSIFGEVQVDYVLSKTDVSFEVETGGISFLETGDYFCSGKPWDVDSDGRVYVAPNWSTHELGYYFVEIYGNNDELKTVFSREFEAYKRSQTERDMQVLSFGGEDRDTYFEEEFEQDIMQIFVHPDGNIWIHTSQSARSQPVDIMITYDVFDKKGHFIKQVSLKYDGDVEKDIVYFLSDDRIIIVKGQTDILNPGLYPEEDGLEVICCSVVQWSGK